MSSRTVRINALVQREISAILRQRYQSEAVAITVTEVKVTPDLRDGRVYVSIVGQAEEVAEKFQWLKRQAPAIREEIGRRVVLKYLPRFHYELDRTAARSVRVLRLLDELGYAPADPNGPDG